MAHRSDDPCVRADDLAAIRADDALVDAIAGRLLPVEGASEPLVRLLLALTHDVDRGGFAGPGVVVPPLVSARPFGRRVARGAGVVALTAVAAFATSNGVAAAVTGDPLVGVKGTAQLVTGTPDLDRPGLPAPGGVPPRR